MPTYQYRCTACGSDTEAVQKFTDAALTECPDCQGELKKVYGNVGVVFKGSGFYATDSRQKQASSTAKSDASSSSSDSATKKSDSTPASTSATSSTSSGASSSSSTTSSGAKESAA